MCYLSMKFQEKIFTFSKIIQVWNFINFGMPEIIPKNLVTLRFLKFLYQVLTGTCKMFQMRYWPNFYVDPTYSNAYNSNLTNDQFICKPLYPLRGYFLAPSGLLKRITLKFDWSVMLWDGMDTRTSGQRDASVEIFF